jgi:hypothetical protein
MKTSEIDMFLKKRLNYFQEVYPIDMLLPSFLKPAMLVVNPDKHCAPGSHWVSPCFYEAGYSEHFGSYGLPPISYEITQYFQSHCTSSKYNRRSLHALKTNVCGHYCDMHTHRRD